MKTSAWIPLIVLTAVIASEQSSAQIISGPTFYRLDQSSSLQQGCFPPCLCPVMIGEPVKGTFLLTPTGFNGLFDTYAVTQVNWLTSINGTNQIVTGSGTYKIGGEVALQQELSLDLQLGPGQVAHFDSGLVPVSATFPRINATISIHGQFCFDTVFSVSASPAPLDQIVSYQLLAFSTFQRGCFGACDCVLGPLESLQGTFILVPLEGTQSPREFAVVNVNWVVPDVSGTLPVRGSGIYQLSGKSGSEQELALLLSIGEESAVFFESGLVSDRSIFPSVDVGISVRDAICFNTWIYLHAAPAPVVRPTKAKSSLLINSE